MILPDVNVLIPGTRFLADPGMSPKLVDFLQDLGHLAIHLQQQGLYRLKDSEILEKACKEGRTSLTHDLDFGDLLAASGADLASLVIFRLRNMRPEHVNRYLLEIISQYRESLDHGAVITVTEGRIRLRDLPPHGRQPEGKRVLA